MEKSLAGRYCVVRELGQGGTGIVYLCNDARLPGKQWAVKRMLPVESGSEGRQREFLEREAAILSRLRHPNLPVVVDSFEEDGEFYLVMEYVEGENLAEHVRRHGPLREREAFRLGLALCDLLAFLHGQSPPIVFRDLKPENCMLSPDGRLQLIDFGLARRYVPGKTSDTMLAGSAGYAPPEQWDSVGQTDPRSDIYAWGATLVFLLTGRVPSPRSPLRVLRARPTPLSFRAAAVIARSLEHLPRHRQAGAAELREEVKAVLEAPEAEVEPEAEPLAEAPRLRWFFPVAAGTLTLLIVLGLGLLARRLALEHLGVPVPPPPSPAASAPPLFALGVSPYRSRGLDEEGVARARQWYEKGRFSEAIALLEQVTARYPEDARAHILAENARLRLAGAPVVVVPFIVALSGVDALGCASDLQGVALAQAAVNAAGGVRGCKVVVECLDDQSSTAVSLEIARRLLQDPAVRVVLGPTSSQRTLALAPLFNEAGVALVAATASASKVWEAGPCVFTASESRGPRVRALARHAVRSGRLRVAAIVDGSSVLSREMASIFKAELQARGGTLLEMPPFQEEARGFREQVDAVVAAAPDLVFFADSHGAALGRFATELRQRGVLTPLCGQATPMERDLVDVGGSNVTGLLLSDSFHPHLDTPAARAFVEAFHARFGDVPPTCPAAENHDAFLAVCEGLRASDTRQGLVSFLRATGVTRPALEGVSGRFAMGVRLDARPVWLIEVVDGRYRLVGCCEEMPASPSASGAPSPEPIPLPPH